MKKVILFVMILSAALVLTACESSSNVYTYILDESFDEFITLGTSADYPPYEWPSNEDGKQTIVGIDIEIAKYIAIAVGKNLRVINKGFDFLLDDLQNGKVDFVLAGMTPTDERALKSGFSKVYYEATQVILIQSANQQTFDSIEALNQSNLKIGAQLGSIQEDLVNEYFTVAQKQIVQAVPDLVMNLSSGLIDAVVLEYPVASGYVDNVSGLYICDIQIGDPDGGSAVAVKKGDDALLLIINQVIDELILSGEMDQIVADAILNNSGSN